MADTARPDLSERQQDILRRLVEDFVASGQPVGSKTLVERGGLGFSASTVRNELSELERLGLLTHPHTSAGRVPTEAGYRFYADVLLEELEPRPGPFALDPAATRSGVDAALEATTETLSQVTRLLALVSAPPLQTTTVRHVEVLLLQPQVVMVVVITSTGGVSKRVFALGDPLDPGLTSWAAEYLNERLAGLRIGSAVLQRRFRGRRPLGPRAGVPGADPSGIHRPARRARATPLRRWAGDAPRRRAHERAGRGAATPRSAGAARSDPRARRRGARLAASDRPRRRRARRPSLRDAALVGASYGLTNRTLGAVSVVGPLRMDYEKAIRTVRAAAHELSRFVEAVYEDN